MHEIVCPHCGKAFKIDEAGYADILKQVATARSSSSCTSGLSGRKGQAECRRACQRR